MNPPNTTSVTTAFVLDSSFNSISCLYLQPAAAASRFACVLLHSGGSSVFTQVKPNAWGGVDFSTDYAANGGGSSSKWKLAGPANAKDEVSLLLRAACLLLAVLLFCWPFRLCLD
jgi:hypothetical protein